MAPLDACPPRARWGLTASAVAVGLWGLGWGLPNAARVELLLPAGLNADPAFHAKLSESWKQLYRDLRANRLLPFDYLTKAETIPGGWELPPARLMNSLRSYFLRTENADEQKVLSYLSTMRPRQLDLRPFGIGYGGAFLYPLGAWYAAFSAVGLVKVSAEPLPYLSDPAVMARVWIVGRLFNALVFVACVAVIASLGGWLAGLLFLAMPAFAITSHYLNPYGAGTLFAFLGLGSCFRYVDSGKPRDLILGSAWLGLSIGATLAYGYFGLAAPLACLLRWRAGARPQDELRAAIPAGLAAVAAFAVANPYLVFDFDHYKDEWAYFGGAPKGLTVAKFTAFVTELLRQNAGVAGTALLLGCVAWALWRRDRLKLVVCAVLFMVGWVTLCMKLTDPTHSRHFMPYFGAGAIVAAAALERLRARYPRAAAAVAAVVLLEAAVLSGGYLHRMWLETTERSTRLLAGRWINENVPAGSSVGLALLPQPSNVPPFRWDRYTIVLFGEPEHLAEVKPPDYLVLGVESRVDPGYLAAHYQKLQSFVSDGPGWLPTRAWYLANTPFDVYRRL